MNIFKVLSDGDGKVYEPSVSAFLAFLLDPKQAHGLDSKFLESFLSPVITSNGNTHPLSINVEKGRYKGASLSLKSDYGVDVQPEHTVEVIKGAGRKTRDIDIFIEISKVNEQNIDEVLHVVCIENKIRSQAIEENQLLDELDGIVSLYEKKMKQSGDSANLPSFSMIFLTPDYSSPAHQAFEQFTVELKKTQFSEDVEVFSDHYIWNVCKGDDRSSRSVYSMLTDLLRQDSLGELDPLHEHTKYIIKCFMSFIKSGFKSYAEEVVAAKKDNSDYEFNSQYYKKSQLPLIVVKEHLRKYPGKTYEELKRDFPDSILKKFKYDGMICTLEAAQKRREMSKKKISRGYVDHASIIKTGDNVSVVVSNQMDVGNITAFIKRAESLGYKIKVASMQSSG